MSLFVISKIHGKYYMYISNSKIDLFKSQQWRLCKWKIRCHCTIITPVHKKRKEQHIKFHFWITIKPQNTQTNLSYYNNQWPSHIIFTPTNLPPPRNTHPHILKSQTHSQNNGPLSISLKATRLPETSEKCETPRIYTRQ